MPGVGVLDMLGAYDGETWLDWSWVADHRADILARLHEHVVLAGLALGWGLAIAFPLALAAASRPRLLRVVLVGTGILYTIPSLAAFALLLPFTGLSRTTAVIPLASYSLLILVRNIVTGIHGVPPDVREAAEGMGYSNGGRLVRVELPLAVPTIVAGVRIAAVTIIGLIPVAALVGQGGLGQLMRDGFARDFRTPLTVGVLLVLLLAFAVDGLLLFTQWLLTPWARRRR
jgi:osmoprotectant transport system permease protein